MKTQTVASPAWPSAMAVQIVVDAQTVMTIFKLFKDLVILPESGTLSLTTFISSLTLALK